MTRSMTLLDSTHSKSLCPFILPSYEANGDAIVRKQQGWNRISRTGEL